MSARTRSYDMAATATHMAAAGVGDDDAPVAAADADSLVVEDADVFPRDLKLYLFVRVAPGAARGATRIGAVSDVRRRLAMYNRGTGAAPWRVGLVLVLPRARRLRTRALVRYWKSAARIPFKRARTGFTLARTLDVPVFAWPAVLEAEAEIRAELAPELAHLRALVAAPAAERRARALAAVARATSATSAAHHFVHRDARRRARSSTDVVARALAGFT